MNSIQGSEKWFQDRCGKITASEIYKLGMSGRTKGSESKTKIDYLWKKAIEICTGVAIEDGARGEHIERGHDMEDAARLLYESRRKVKVEEVGMIEHPTLKMAGASPDGLVGDDGLVEIKCKKPENHIQCVLSGEIPKEHREQMQWQMACTGRKWCDYVQFCADVPKNIQLVVIRVERDDEFIKVQEERVENAIITIAEYVDEILNFKGDRYEV